MATTYDFLHTLKNYNHLRRLHSWQKKRYFFAFLGRGKHEAGVDLLPASRVSYVLGFSRLPTLAKKTR